ncbi:ArsR/SmtB family transcription factor [Micromonospora sp. NBC_01813]|uniref:ArsR/SmtB family transcription factor n=1 Tax=Micromonospora sp. NBC_01813 TaxID=2975988 RepID=UPI002DD9434A|nr:helix-turn-helix domain-containing protein [Micromonospora sp. NBC_01813]WSA06686.1 helix-turn-helix domain-containing protein [Micromonospora sp. NBC_01813]
MQDIEVIEDPQVAAAALEPTRSRLLAALAEPASATELAGRTGLTRQRANYHLKALEQHGLVHPAGERRHGGLTERLLVASAAAYLVSPAALGDAAGDPACTADRGSARYLIALAARTIRELTRLLRRADASGERVVTLSLDSELRLASSPQARAAFADDLTAAVAAVIRRHHLPADAPGDDYRLIVTTHPKESL